MDRRSAVNHKGNRIAPRIAINWLSRMAVAAQLATQNVHLRRCVDADLRSLVADSKKRNRDVLTNAHGFAAFPTDN